MTGLPLGQITVSTSSAWAVRRCRAKVDPARFRFWLVYRTLWWALGCLQMGQMWRSGADRTVDVLIQTRPLPSTLTEMTACLRGPGLAQEEKSLNALLASTKIASH